MSISEALIDAKLNNKTNVFFIHYKLKDNQIGKYKLSFLNYDENRIIADMKSIESNINFDHWLSYFELKK